jgi:hypothetical protein
VDGGTVVGYQTLAGTAVTAEDGTYTIHFLVPGSYTVTVDLDPGLASDPENLAVELANSENATGADFDVLDVTGTISGTVSTALAGESVEGLAVTATPDDQELSALTAATASDGTYTIESVVPGAYTVTVGVGDDRLTDPADRAVEIGASEDPAGVDFAVVEDLTGTIAGTVSTALDGVSIEGLTVTATPTGPGLETVTGTTAADGTYTIESVAAGAYNVTVTVGVGFATDPASQAVVLAQDENRTGVDFAVVTGS